MSGSGAGSFHPVAAVDSTVAERAHQRSRTKDGALYKGRLSAVEVRRAEQKSAVAWPVAHQ